MEKAKFFKDHPIDLSSFAQMPQLSCGAAAMPGQSLNAKQIDAWFKFLKGEWLEDRVATLVREVLDSERGSYRLHTGVFVNVCGHQFELDVLILRGHRLFAVSCSTETKDQHICKGKLFEVAYRARQLGGDLARFAFVCLLDKDKKGNDWAAKLEAQIGATWDAPIKPRVFGINHFRSWIDESKQDLSGLRKWLRDE